MVTWIYMEFIGEIPTICDPRESQQFVRARLMWGCVKTIQKSPTSDFREDKHPESSSCHLLQGHPTV